MVTAAAKFNPNNLRNFNNLRNIRSLDVAAADRHPHDARIVRPESERRGCPIPNPWRPAI
jgi:hypothetical protein